MSTFKNNQISVIEAIAGGKIGIDFQTKEEDTIGEAFTDMENEEVIISSFGFSESHRIIIGTSKDKTKIEVFQSSQVDTDEKSILRFTNGKAGKSCFITPEAFAAPVIDALLKASKVEGGYKPFFELITNFMKLES